jgi:hypothetical protein
MAAPSMPPAQAPGHNGKQLGTWVTKTTVEKMFIPEGQATPVPQQVTTTQAAPLIATPVKPVVPVQQIQPIEYLPPYQAETVMVPAISGNAALAPDPSSMRITGGPAAMIADQAGSRYVPIPGAGEYMDGMQHYGDAYANGYQIDDQGQEGYDNGYAYFQEDQHLNQQQLANLQYADGGYIELLDENQVDEQLRNISYPTSPSRNAGSPYDDIGADVAAGIPRPQEEKLDGEGNGNDDQFSRLLNSLEARVDLMAQMQHTRAEIQKHTRNLQNTKTQSRTMALPSTEPRETPIIELEPDRPFSSLMTQIIPDNRMSEGTEALVPLGGAGARLARENAILRNEFQDQKEVIGALYNEVEGMKDTLRSIGVESQPLDRTRTDIRTEILRGPGDILGVGSRVEARWMKDDGSSAKFGHEWLAGQIHRVNEDGTFQVEYDNGAACLRVPRSCLRHLAEADGVQNVDEVKRLQMALQQERQSHDASTPQWTRERQRLLDELSTLKGGGRCALGNLPTVGEVSEIDTSSVVTGFSLLHTNPVLPANGLQFTGLTRHVTPLCRNPCGANIELSEDGYYAKRIRGCRQSVVMGNTPLEPQELGHYFEVVVRETVNGWVGGLGIGVTRMSPAELKRMPDKAWRIPSTFIVGYWGCLFLDGREKRTNWKADTLTVGSRVGLLVTGDGRGDLIVFVDGEPVVRADDVLPASGLRAEELYPVIDVFAATLAVELQGVATAPPKPWAKNPSPPGSPGSATRSVAGSADDTRRSTYSVAQSNISFVNA